MLYGCPECTLYSWFYLYEFLCFHSFELACTTGSYVGGGGERSRAPLFPPPMGLFSWSEYSWHRPLTWPSVGRGEGGMNTFSFDLMSSIRQDFMEHNWRRRSRRYYTYVGYSPLHALSPKNEFIFLLFTYMDGSTMDLADVGPFRNNVISVVPQTMELYNMMFI
jgi:hypothetical protein